MYNIAQFVLYCQAYLCQARLKRGFNGLIGALVERAYCSVLENVRQHRYQELFNKIYLRRNLPYILQGIFVIL